MDQIIGQIELFGFDYAPMGWMLCDGTKLNITSYAPLFSLVGTSYGGDGRTYFCLPNLLGTEPVPDMNYYIAYQGEYPARQ